MQKGEKKKWNKCWYVPYDTFDEVRTALQFTLSQDITAAVSPGHAELLWLACDALEALPDNFKDNPICTDIKGEPIFTTDF